MEFLSNLLVKIFKILKIYWILFLICWQVCKSKLKNIDYDFISKYGHECKNNKTGDDYTSGKATDETMNAEEEEVMSELEHVVSKSSKISKKLSWHISVVDNEGKTANNYTILLYDKKAIKIFAEALKKWQLKLFEHAKENSKDFVKLVYYFYDVISLKFEVHYIRYVVYTHNLDEKGLPCKEIQYCEQVLNNVLQDLEVYVFLINNVPSLFEKFKNLQCILSMMFDENTKIRSKDFLKLIELKVNEVNNE